MAKSVVHGISLFSDQDIYLFKEGKHYKLYDRLGSHQHTFKNQQGTLFALWAPNAEYVSVSGDFNNWDPKAHPLAVRWDGSGIWEGFIPELGKGTLYKYHIVSRYNKQVFEKADPFAKYSECPPKTASIVWDLSYDWNDQDWMKTRKKFNSFSSPISIYEMHIGSWKRKENNQFYSYKELGDILVEYVKDLGFTFVEFLPVKEHPFYGSWGYQSVSYFAPSSRFGNPEELMYLIDRLHKNGIGVILDWSPAHFPSDAHGLVYFDGTNLYEHADPRKGFHPDWNSCIFNYGRNEIKEFLINSALFWLEKYHADAIRIDAVASMLYLDYSRNEGEWVPNINGGRENLEAIDFLQELNTVAYEQFDDIQMIAEESTAWPMVTRPAYVGGLGFGMKWNMGWMHDTLRYFSYDPVHRKYHHDELTFSMVYAFNENFLLPLSHDEVVHGKGSLYNKMPGDEWQKFANLRLLYGYMYSHPGKKLLFMGAEFGKRSEWDHDVATINEPWDDYQKALYTWVKDLNHFYQSESTLYEVDFHYEGFEWIDRSDYEKSILSYMRKDIDAKHFLIAVCNFTPVIREKYRIGLPKEGKWQMMLNSDDKKYGGSGIGVVQELNSEKKDFHGRPFSCSLTLPPLGIVMLKWIGQ